MSAGAGSMLMGSASLGSAISAAEGAKAQGRYEEQQAEANKRLSQRAAADALARGDKEASLMKSRGKQVVGSQRASMAAQGISIDSGSAMDLQTETMEMAAIDSETIKNNAYREAWGYKVQALNTSSQGKFSAMAAKNIANNTLLTGGLKAASYGTEYVDSSSKPKTKKEV